MNLLQHIFFIYEIQTFEKSIMLCNVKFLLRGGAHGTYYHFGTVTLPDRIIALENYYPFIMLQSN